MDTNCVFDVYYDSLTEANWFSSLHPMLDIDKNNYHIIERRGSNPPLIEEITKYDKPDIILVKDGVPLLVIEITQEVPTGHNVGQRFARLVRAVEMGIPTIYYFPFDAKKHGEHANICHLNIRLLKAVEKMLEIHNAPLLCVNWITDEAGEIITDGSENDKIKEIIKSYIESDFNKFCDGIVAHLEFMREEYRMRLAERPSYAYLPNSVKKERTRDFISEYGISGVPETIVQRPFTYIYTMDMTPAKCKRQDPYTGTAFIYDYLVCRNGADVCEKNNNLVLYFPSLTKEIWERKNPNNLATKSCNWYLTANMLVFEDGYIVVRG